MTSLSCGYASVSAWEWRAVFKPMWEWFWGLAKLPLSLLSHLFLNISPNNLPILIRITLSPIELSFSSHESSFSLSPILPDSIVPVESLNKHGGYQESLQQHLIFIFSHTVTPIFEARESALRRVEPCAQQRDMGLSHSINWRLHYTRCFICPPTLKINVLPK